MTNPVSPRLDRPMPTDLEREMFEVLDDWERTPGNHRNSVWWHSWEDKRRAALDIARKERTLP